MAGFQQDILGRVNNTIKNTKAMHGQGIIIWDITGCGCTSTAMWDAFYLGDPRFLNPSASGLTVRTDYGPYVPPTSKLGRQGLEPAMDAITNQLFASIRNAGLIPGICLRAEKVPVTAYGQIDAHQGDGEIQYDTVAHQLADLNAKLTYAYNRWGCRIFYVDSNFPSADVQTALQNQGNPTWAPAYIYTQLRQRHPDCLICPEEWYSGAFSFPSAGINDPAWQYSRVTCRYTELRNPVMEPFVSADESAAAPGAFTLINLDNRGTSDPTNQSRVVNALKKGQCILLAIAWWQDPALTLAIHFQTVAHVNGF